MALYQREAAAQDAGVSSEGTGFRGLSLHYIVFSNDAVDEVMGKAVAAGGSVGVLRVLQRPGRLPLEGRGFVARLALSGGPR